MKKDNLDSLLQKKRLGSLTEDEAEELNARLLAEPELAEELEFQTFLQAVGDELIARDLRQKMERWDEEVAARQQRRRRVAWLMLLAALLAATAIGWRFLKNQNSAPMPVAEASKMPEQKTEAPENQRQNLPPDLVAHLAPAGKSEEKTPATRPKKQVQNATPVRPKKQEETAAPASGDPPAAAGQTHVEDSRSNPFTPVSAFDSLLWLADQASESGRLGEASARLLEIISRHPNRDEQLRLRLAQVYRRQGNLEAAIELLENILEERQAFRQDFELALLECFEQLLQNPDSSANAALLNRHKPRVQALLNELVGNPNHPLHEKAKRMREAGGF